MIIFNIKKFICSRWLRLGFAWLLRIKVVTFCVFYFAESTWECCSMILCAFWATFFLSLTSPLFINTFLNRTFLVLEESYAFYFTFSISSFQYPLFLWHYFSKVHLFSVRGTWSVNIEFDRSGCLTFGCSKKNQHLNGKGNINSNIWIVSELGLKFQY